MDMRIESVAVDGPQRLLITWRHGRQTSLDLADLIAGNKVFEPLKRKAEFSRVVVSVDGWTLEWPSGAHLSSADLSGLALIESTRGVLSERVALGMLRLRFQDSKRMLRRALLRVDPRFDEMCNSAHHYDGCAFFSHQTADDMTVRRFDDLLSTRAASVSLDTHPYWRFFENNLGEGPKYEHRVALALCLANVVVLFASPNTLRSRYVQIEIDVAIALATPIICVSIDKCELNKIHPALTRRELRYGDWHRALGDSSIFLIDLNEYGEERVADALFSLLTRACCRPRRFGGPSHLA